MRIFTNIMHRIVEGLVSGSEIIGRPQRLRACICNEGRSGVGGLADHRIPKHIP